MLQMAVFVWLTFDGKYPTPLYDYEERYEKFERTYFFLLRAVQKKRNETNDK